MTTLAPVQILSLTSFSRSVADEYVGKVVREFDLPCHFVDRSNDSLDWSAIDAEIAQKSCAIIVSQMKAQIFSTVFDFSAKAPDAANILLNKSPYILVSEMYIEDVKLVLEGLNFSNLKEHLIVDLDGLFWHHVTSLEALDDEPAHQHHAA